MAEILQVQGVTKKFGGLTANNEISFQIEEGAVVGVVGPNGAGKTTLFDIISRHQNPTSGKIIFNGENITNLKANQACRLGIGRTFQIPQTMIGLSVVENIMVGALSHINKVSEAKEYAEEVADFCGLSHKNNFPAETLNVMEKKRLEIARALATKPKLLLLDETMAGLNGAERNKAIDLILAINDRGISILMIEHVMEVIMRVSEKVVVIASGKVIMDGTPSEVISDEQVINAYLGGGFHAKSR